MRRTKEAAEATRQALLDTALALFASAGPEAVTLKQIASAAGVTHGALYWHFRNKADLLQQLYEISELPFERHALEQRQAVQQDALGALQHFLLGSLQELHSRDRLLQIYRVFHYGRARSPELVPLQGQLNAEARQWYEQVHYFLKQARKQKQIRKKLDLDRLSRALVAACTGLLDLWIGDPSDFALLEQARVLLTLQLEGLKEVKPAQLAR